MGVLYGFLNCFNVFVTCVDIDGIIYDKTVYVLTVLWKLLYNIYKFYDFLEKRNGYR